MRLSSEKSLRAGVVAFRARAAVTMANPQEGARHVLRWGMMIAIIVAVLFRTARARPRAEFRRRNALPRPRRRLEEFAWAPHCRPQRAAAVVAVIIIINRLR
jgi:hypothetical protein